MDAYYNSYTKKDVRMVKEAIQRFRDFIEREYPLYKTRILPEQLNKEMMLKFVDYLQEKGKGSGGAVTYYKRFKKLIKYLVENNYIQKILVTV